MTCRARIRDTILLYSQKIIETNISLFPEVFDDFDRLSLQRERAYILRSTLVNHVMTSCYKIFLYPQKTINSEKSLFPVVFEDVDRLPLQPQ